MTTNATFEQSSAPAAAGVGRIARITGPVVDIEFPHDAMPGIYNALKTQVTMGEESFELTLEVAQHLGDRGDADLLQPLPDQRPGGEEGEREHQPEGLQRQRADLDLGIHGRAATR